MERDVRVEAAGAVLNADLVVPDSVRGVVAFAHGSASSRHSPRNRQVARRLNDAGFATLLADLLTAGEEPLDEATGRLRFDIDLLADRMTGIVDWFGGLEDVSGLPVGLFGASTGAAAALAAAADRPEAVGAVVSRGGRPDLAGQALTLVTAPTLLIVGGYDDTVLAFNEQVVGLLGGAVELRVVPGATHLFPEPGALEQVAGWAVEWFSAHL
jgi:dienelactone hydrolase